MALDNLYIKCVPKSILYIRNIFHEEPSTYGPHSRVITKLFLWWMDQWYFEIFIKVNRTRYFSAFSTMLSIDLSQISLEHSTVCSNHVTYSFQSESTLYSCLNAKELLAQKRPEIWSLSNRNGTRTHNHLACKRILNHVAIFLLLYTTESCNCQRKMKNK